MIKDFGQMMEQELEDEGELEYDEEGLFQQVEEGKSTSQLCCESYSLTMNIQRIQKP